MVHGKIIFILTFVLRTSTFYSQTSIETKQNEKAIKTVQIADLVQIKNQFPDSFLRNRLDHRLALLFYSIDDIPNFTATAIKFLKTDDSKDRWRVYEKTGLCKL